MIKAIHKETGKLVSSYKLNSDTSWIGCEKEIFLAPKPQIGNWKELVEKGIYEVEVSFVRGHKRTINNKEVIIIPHFRIKTDGAVENPENESYEHLISKEGIYEEILNDTLFIGTEKLSSLGKVVDVDIEHRESPSRKSKIYDVYCKFEKKHEVYGKGIVFEIQFSYQKKEVLEERTYDRILKGYSVCWLFEGDFFNNKLKNKKLEVIPFSKAIKDFNQIVEEDRIKGINRISRIVEDKLYEVERKIHQMESTIDSKIDGQINFMLEKKEEIASLIRGNFDIIESNCSSEIMRFGDGCEKIKDKIFFELSNDEEILSNLKKSIDIKEIKDQLKSELFEQVRDSILLNTKNLVENYLQINSKIYKELVRESYHASKKQCIEEMNLAFKEAMLFSKCPECKEKFRIESTQILDGKILCGGCYLKLKGEVKEDGEKKEGIC